MVSNSRQNSRKTRSPATKKTLKKMSKKARISHSTPERLRRLRKNSKNSPLKKSKKQRNTPRPTEKLKWVCPGSETIKSCTCTDGSEAESYVILNEELKKWLKKQRYTPKKQKSSPIQITSLPPKEGQKYTWI